VSPTTVCGGIIRRAVIIDPRLAGSAVALETPRWWNRRRRLLAQVVMSYKFNPGDARWWSLDAALGERLTEASLHELGLVFWSIPDFDHDEAASVIYAC
jgi:hypothetical protein